MRSAMCSSIRCAISDEERARRPPAAGTGGHLRPERAQAERLEDLHRDADLLGAVAARLRRERHADRVADPLVEQDREGRGRGDRALHAHAGLGQAEVERIVAAARELAVDRHEVGHAADLRADDDAVVAQAGRLGELGRAQGGLQHRLDRHVARVERVGPSGVLVHQGRQEVLVERAPVHPDADGPVVFEGDPDDRDEVLVVPLRADVARVDPVLRERGRRVRVLGQELVAVVVEVPDERDADPEVVELAPDRRDGARRGVVVDRHAHELAAGVRERRDLERGRVSVGRVGVRHRLDDDRGGGPHGDAADVDEGRRASDVPDGRAHPTSRPMSWAVTHTSRAMSNAKPVR